MFIRKMYETISRRAVQSYSDRLHKKLAYDNAPNLKERFKDQPTFLNGWHPICMEKELKKNTIVSKNLMGVDIIVWKDEKGTTSIMDAHCPHLGVHLASGGEILNDEIRCAFHHRCFNTKGKCSVKGQKGVDAYPVRINGGIVFAWIHKDKLEPTWEIPNLEIDEDHTEWKIVHEELKGVRVSNHPSTFIENGVDYNHAVKLHGLCHSHSTVEEDGEVLKAHLIRLEKDKGEIKIRAYGPFIIEYNFKFKFVINIKYRFLMVLQFNKDGSFMAHRIKMKPKKYKNIRERIFYSGVFIYTEYKLFKAFMSEDHLIMVNRKHLEKPNYDKEDKYIPKFRKWYKQFSA